jgi:hypothetical protein
VSNGVQRAWSWKSKSSWWWNQVAYHKT